MISFSATVQDAFKEPVIETFYLLKITGIGNKTDYFRPLVVDGVTYLADGTVLRVELPQMSSVVDRQLFKITLSDVTLELGVAAEAVLFGKKVEVRLGFVSQTTGQPDLNLANTLLIYKGYIDSVSYSISTANVGEAIFQVSCASPMGDLDLIRQYYTSQDYLDKNHPGDTSFEQIFEGSGPISKKWGKS